jgi:drug/metabolite transporter (DMT)-like permease
MINPSQWLLLALLSVLWGGSFLFVGIAVSELPAFTIVFGRVGLAALLLLPVVIALGLQLPASARGWWPFLVMALLNNVIPFSAIVLGQKEIASGLASVLNATTPLFGVMLTHLLTDDKMSANKFAGLAIGIVGVALLMGPAVLAGDRTSVQGMALVLTGTLAYGCASVWGRRLRTTPPLVSAVCQLACSTLVMALLAGAIDRPWTLPPPSPRTLLAMLGLAALSTALAYAVFFRILAVSGPTNVMLVTLLIPISGVALGTLVLGETVHWRQVLGALVIASGLVVIDGRAVPWSIASCDRAA